MIDPQTAAKLQEIPAKAWGPISKQLVLYAEFRLEKVGFEPRSEKDTVNGEDFVNQAIEKLFDGTRKWDFNRHPDVLIHLKGIVKSLIWSHIKSSGRAAVKRSPVPAALEGAEEINFFTEIPDHETPEEIIISEETWKEIEKHFGDDSDGFIIFCDWLDGVSPRKIAEDCKIDVKVVYNAARKGKRIISKIFTVN